MKIKTKNNMYHTPLSQLLKQNHKIYFRPKFRFSVFS